MTVVTVTEYELIPIGEYTMRAVDYVQVSGVDYGGKPQEQWKWTAEFVDPIIVTTARGEKNIQGETKFFWTKFVPDMRNDLGKFAQACGIPIEVGMPLDLDDLLFKPFTAEVLIGVKKNGDEYNKIGAIKPPRRAQATRKLAAPDEIAAAKAKAAEKETTDPRPLSDANGDVDAASEDPFTAANAPASKLQVMRLTGLLTKGGCAAEEIDAYVESVFGVKAMSDLTAAQITKAIAEMAG